MDIYGYLWDGYIYMGYNMYIYIWMNDRDLTGMMMRLRVIILSAIFRLVNY